MYEKSRPSIFMKNKLWIVGFVSCYCSSQSKCSCVRTQGFNNTHYHKLSKFPQRKETVKLVFYFSKGDGLVQETSTIQF